MKERELYSYIKSYNIFTNNSSTRQNPVFKWSNNKIEEFVNGLFQRIHPVKASFDSYFDFHANSTLSGEPYPCTGIECRMNNIENLSRFAAFYADKVIIKSPIDKHFNCLKSGKKINREDLLIDLLILLYIKPLVISRIIEFSSEYICLCKDCMKEVVEDESAFNNKIRSLENTINYECLNTIECRLKLDGDYPYITITGAEKYGFYAVTDFSYIKYIPKEIKKLSSNKANHNMILPKEIVLSLDVIYFIMSHSYQDLIENNIYSARYGYSYLTDRDIDVKMINLLHTKDNLQESKNLSDNLFHKLPLIADIEINDAIKLRNKDGEAFKVYRDSINKILSERKTYDKKSLLEIQRDIIMPELNRIDLTIKNNKKALLGSIAYDFTFWSACLSIGIFSGILPLKMAPIIGAVGGLTTAKDTLSKLKDTISVQETIRNENYYFLWKLLK